MLRYQDQEGNQSADKIADQLDDPGLPRVVGIDMVNDQKDLLGWIVFNEVANGSDGQGDRVDLEGGDQIIDQCGHRGRQAEGQYGFGRSLHIVPFAAEKGCPHL